MKYNKFNIIHRYFDFIISTHLKNNYNQKILFEKFQVYDLQLYTDAYFSNFVLNGSTDYYEKNDVFYNQSYASALITFFHGEKIINLKLMKKFIQQFSKFKTNNVLISGDNLYKSITNKNDDHHLSQVNGVAILRPFIYIINNFKQTDCLKNAIQITKIINNHPYEIIATFLLFKTIVYLNKNNNPYKLFKHLISSLENISDKNYKLLLGDFNNNTLFDKFKLEIIANIDEFVRIVYNNHNNIPVLENRLLTAYSDFYNNFNSKIILNNYPNRHKLLCNNGISVLCIAINIYIQYFKHYQKNFIPLQYTVLQLVSILGYSHHSSILLSYFIYLLDHDSFIKKIPKKIFTKLQS
jgi:hypothetical protein